ncbi:RDD family protein [Massilia sp. PAMC28688]|uniref:RDD family protein n=1 Tax=Massilia sp. PAMC28688 TaxID=2861283 RepID=UPI001C631368|nr:RDD family protein [Massilia sp. PAMC28688]QYF95019.1 RDD family protein [Massilia sp. PAMC28688]
MSLDPYAPPLAPMQGLTPAEAANTGLKYSTFWGRVGAGLLDCLFISPILAMHFLFGDSVQFYTLSMWIFPLVSLFYYVFLVAKFGATPGKLVLGQRISMLDGSPVTAKAAFMRYSLWWILAIVSAIGSTVAVGALSPEAMAGGYMERSLALTATTPSWAMAAGYATQALLLASLVVVLINKQRRTVHDYLAGTVVVRKK